MRLRACILPDNMVRCNWSIGEDFLFPFITAEILHIKKKEYNQSLRLYAQAFKTHRNTNLYF